MYHRGGVIKKYTSSACYRRLIKKVSNENTNVEQCKFNEKSRSHKTANQSDNYSRLRQYRKFVNPICGTAFMRDFDRPFCMYKSSSRVNPFATNTFPMHTDENCGLYYWKNRQYGSQFLSNFIRISKQEIKTLSFNLNNCNRLAAFDTPRAAMQCV